MDDDYHDEDPGPRPLDRDEAERVRRDLDDLVAFRQAFEPEGYKGVSVFCEDCVEQHFYGWQMLEENLTALLESGETPVHEPAYDPRPHEYIDWQYAQGYLDGLADSGVGPVPAPLQDAETCPFCVAELPQGTERLIFCPECGTHMGAARLARILLNRGWSADEVRQALNASHFPPLRTLLADDHTDDDRG